MGKKNIDNEAVIKCSSEGEKQLKNITRVVNTHGQYDEAFLHKIIDHIPIGIIISISQTEEIEYMNKTFSLTFGYKKQDAASESILYDQAYPNTSYREKIIKQIKEIPQNHCQRSGDSAIETKIKCKNGSYRYAEISILYFQDRKLITFTDITKSQNAVKTLVKTNECLENLALTDYLTGIANRMRINSILEIELSRAERYNNFFSVVMFDIDFFKTVNDNYGHTVGDNVLVKIAEAVSERLRTSDCFGRLGGDEFIIILPETFKEQAFLLIEQIRINLSELDIPQKITISAGITQYLEGDDFDSLLTRVDTALYSAKEKGRNCVVIS
ncbi:MAG: GGDEF domain-containing protein [Clostridia bacterium]|nr:GGDEF domain-containing protein [Clostridia bacterium]